MSDNNIFFPGKIKHDILRKMFKNYVSDLRIHDKRIIIGSEIGEDAAVISTNEDQLLVVKTDPITFTSDLIGYYAVNVNVNDVVCTGAKPKWFLSTILLPEIKTTYELIESIFKEIHDTCQSMNITVIGGHTEITEGLNRPIVVGTLIGEVDHDKLVKTSGAEKGDLLVLTKGIFIEGTSIIAREKENILEKEGFDKKFIEKCKNYIFNPGISVYKEAFLVNQHFKIKAMHDPTEGGLFMGIAEIAIASNLGVIVDKREIPIYSEAKELSERFNLNPYGTITSGSLLIVIEEKDAEILIDFLIKNNIFAAKIGKFIEKEKGFFLNEGGGKITPLNYSERDEITKIFNNKK
ncbi:MAG: hydrogenase expression/formation protein [Candidatus Lokiarchaeota archaeon]|nr:hydrogenase expression/formation protein [Candidatus Lokiarchaeota archaeon]